MEKPRRSKKRPSSRVSMLKPKTNETSRRASVERFVLPHPSALAYVSDEYTHRSSMSWMVQMPGPLERNQRLSTVLRIG